MRKTGRIAADHVGGDGSQAEYVLEIEQRAQVPILGLELGQARAIARDLCKLGAQLSVLFAHVNEVHVVVHDRRDSGGEVREGRVDRTDDFQKGRLRTRGEIARMNPGRDQMERQDKQRAAGQQHPVAPEKAASHVNSARRAR